MAATRLAYVVAAEGFAAVAPVERFAGPGRGAGRGDRATRGTARKLHLGLDGRPAARIPDPPAMHRGDLSCAHRAYLLRPGGAHPIEPLDRPGQKRPRHSAHLILIRLFGQILDRRLAVDPSEKQARQQPRRPRSSASRALPRRRPPDRSTPEHRSSRGIRPARVASRDTSTADGSGRRRDRTPDRHTRRTRRRGAPARAARSGCSSG